MAVKCSIEELKDSFNEIYEFIGNNDLKSLATGRYFLDKGIYVNVDTYVSKPIEECKYEAHKKYIDIQMLINGNEDVYVSPISQLTYLTEYDSIKDIMFFNGKSENKYEMKENDCLILYPQDGHMPCVNPDKLNIKKIVFKIPMSYRNNIKCLIMDVDGTLTDGKIYMGNDGELFKAFDIKDGYAIANILKQNSIIPVILTGRQSKIVENRANELGIKHIYQNVSNKLEKLDQIVKELNIGLSNVMYVGDDNNDLPCIEYINKNNGLSACPSDASKAVKENVNYIANLNGGKGAVREIIDWICDGK